MDMTANAGNYMEILIIMAVIPSVKVKHSLIKHFSPLGLPPL